MIRIFYADCTRRWARAFFVIALCCLIISCRSADVGTQQQQELIVGAAANLTDAFNEIGQAFTAESGIKITYNYGSTAELTEQVKNGAPFDVFAAADVMHIDQLVESGHVLPESRAVYARGRLALWIPAGSKANVDSVEGLISPTVRFVSIATPASAPYGAAAVEALKRLQLWDKVEPKVVYAPNINAAKQMAATGNADVTFTAYSLVLNESGKVLPVEESLHAPLNQALGIVSASMRRADAERFVAFVLRGGGAQILKRYGYEVPQ
jgi:molybdate transport system substrate-binding protein